MAKMYIMGNYTEKAFQGFLKDPNSDRKAVVEKLVKGVGGTLHTMDIVRGSYDFCVVADLPSFDDFAAVKLVVESTGAVKNLSMAKFYTLGCYTAKGLGGFVSNPSTDRKAATSALAASVGAKVTQYSGLRGKYDFMAVIEGTFEQAAAAAMVAVSSGAVSDFTILEDVDLNEIAKTAQKMASSYKEPGK